MSEYLLFADPLPSESGKTSVVQVQAVRDGAPLGTIKWFGRWRQYAFFPEPGTLFNPDCLDQISRYVRDLTRDHRRTG